MEYVQDLFNGELLIDNDDQIPWLVVMTKTGLPRLLNQDDQIVIDGNKYTISVVRPTNRNSDSVFDCIIYPERTDPEDLLAIYNVQIRDKDGEYTSFKDLVGKDVVLDLVYGGVPTQMSFDNKVWIPFKPEFIYTVMGEEPITLWLKDKNNIVVNKIVG